MTYGIRVSRARRSVLIGALCFATLGTANSVSAAVDDVLIAHGKLVEDPTVIESLRYTFFPGTHLPQTIEAFVYVAKTPHGEAVDSCADANINVDTLEGMITTDTPMALTADDYRSQGEVWINTPLTDEIWKTIPVDLSELAPVETYLLVGFKTNLEDLRELVLTPAFKTVNEVRGSSWISLDGGGVWTCVDLSIVDLIFQDTLTDGGAQSMLGGASGVRLPDVQEGAGSPFLNILIEPEEPR